MYRQYLMSPLICLCLLALMAACTGARPTPETGLAEIDGIQVYYEILGKGTPLVLIHGGSLDSRMWDDQFQSFAKHYKVIRYDLPGFGKSESPTSTFSNVEVLHGLLAHLNIDQAHLLGLSLGGRIAIDFALEYPQQVSSLVLAAPGLSGYVGSTEEMNRQRAMKLTGERDGGLKAIELWLQDPFMAPAMENPVCRDRVRQLATENARFWEQPYLERAPKQWAMLRLSEIQVPTLVVIGDRDVEDIQVIASLLEEGIAGARMVAIRDSGHLINMEQPDMFDTSVLEFLGGLEQEQ